MRWLSVGVTTLGRVTGWAGRRFRSGLVHLRLGLPLLVGDEIVGLLDIDEAAVRAWLATGPAPTGGVQRLHVDRKDALLPMRVPFHTDGVGLVGWLLPGLRPDGSLYGREERATLAEITDPPARALAITIARPRSEIARTAREAGLRREISELRAPVDRVTAQLGLETGGLPSGHQSH